MNDQRAVSERRRLSEGPAPKERSVVGTERFTARCRGSAAQVLGNVKEALAVVLAQDPDRWPTEEAWPALLPGWFLTRCAPEKSREEAEEWMRWWRTLPDGEQQRVADEAAWSLQNWVHWFELDNREWWWWDGRVKDENTVEIDVEVDGYPFPSGSLRWLLRASGAESVTA